MFETLGNTSYPIEKNVSKIVAAFIGGAITIAGAVLWYLLTILRINFVAPSWAPWLHTAVIIAFGLFYLPIGFVVLFSTSQFVKYVSERLDKDETPLISDRRVAPHRITRKIAIENSKNREKVGKSISTRSGSQITVEDLGDILFDIPRNPLVAILVDHIPRMLFVRKGQYSSLGRWRRMRSYTVRLLVPLAMIVFIGFLAWETDTFILFLAVASSMMCQVLSFAFWEYSRIRYFLTSQKLGFIEWRLFFGKKTQPCVRTNDITQTIPASHGFGLALQSLGFGWGDIDFRTTEQEEIWNNLRNISNPDLISSYISAVSIRTQTNGGSSDPGNESDIDDTVEIPKLTAADTRRRRLRYGRPTGGRPGGRPPA